MRVTRLGPSIPILTLTGILSESEGGPSGQVPTANGSNSVAWGSNVANIWSNGSNKLLGPETNIAAGSNIFLTIDQGPLPAQAYPSNTLRIHSIANAGNLTIVDTTNLYSSTTIEGALGEIGSTLYNPGIIRVSDTVGDPAGKTMSNANQAAWVRWHGAGVITAIAIQVIVSSGNICAAVYAPTGGTGLNNGLGRDAGPGARKATTGSIACPGSGFASLSLGGSIRIDPGDWMGFSCDNTSAFFIMIDDGGTGLVSDTFKGLRYYRGVFTLPDPAGPDGRAMLRFPFAVGIP